MHSLLLESRAFGSEAGVTVKGPERDGNINQERLMTGMRGRDFVYGNGVQFKIYRRFNATAWQSLKSTAQKTVTLRKILQL